jgi:predicted GNAT family acetyltransferase
MMRDLGTFAERALPHLMVDPVRNNVACSLVECRAAGDVPVEPDALWLQVENADRELVGVALATPPHPLLLAEMSPAAVDVLVAHLSGIRTGLSGVTGPAELASRFATGYAAATGTEATPVRSLRMFRLDRVAPPAGVDGRAREAGSVDRDLLVEWSAAFEDEALAGSPQVDPAAPVDRRLGRPGLLWVWECGGEPVSMAYRTPPSAGVVRVSGVYTPPRHRCRGYASACVAAVSEQALKAGATACVLYTDLANPTSNKIYQAIGYRAVEDSQEWRFSRASGGSPG